MTSDVVDANAHDLPGVIDVGGLACRGVRDINHSQEGRCEQKVMECSAGIEGDADDPAAGVDIKCLRQYRVGPSAKACRRTWEKCHCVSAFGISFGISCSEPRVTN
jgi:hypothetical protein